MISLTSVSSKYYIFAPAKCSSGGPEALHQLAFYMCQSGMAAYIVYYEYGGFVKANPVDKYLQYNPHVVCYDEIEDVTQNYCIAPENAPWCLNGIKQAKRCLWWLSVSANNVRRSSVTYRLKYLIRELKGKDVFSAREMLHDIPSYAHYCGNKYAYEYIKKNYPCVTPRYLVEPISKDFLTADRMQLSRERRLDIVLYNPAKPSVQMTKLLERKVFTYVPLESYAPAELAIKYCEAKLYVDFGEFGGPERMPKEAVYFGCNILVADHNAASNDFDVAIPKKYKLFDDSSIEEIEQRIGDMLSHYDDYYADFNPFRQKIEHLEENFIKQIKEMVQDNFSGNALKLFKSIL